jgi:hypothetical protein
MEVGGLLERHSRQGWSQKSEREGRVRVKVKGS